MGGILTKKQEKVLMIIRDMYLQQGQAPSLGELQDILGISSKRGVVNHLIALEKKGYILRTGEPRGIHIVEEDEEIVYDYLIGVAVLGYANAGTPMVAAEEDRLGTIRVDRSLIEKKSDLFSLIVKGDSMDMAEVGGKNISDGSYLIVQKDAEIENGDIVVAVIENSATVKRIKKGKDMITLYPESSNPANQPIFLNSDTDFLINGKVVKVLESPI